MILNSATNIIFGGAVSVKTTLEQWGFPRNFGRNYITQKDFFSNLPIIQ